MKRKLLVMIAMVCLFVANAESKTRFSVMFNPAVNWLSSDVKKVKYDSPALGFDAGLTMDNFFAERYAFSTGITIGSYGGKLKYNESTTFDAHGDGEVSLPAGTTVKYKLQYITIPIGLKLKTNEIGYFTYYANLGFNTQINIKAKADSNDSQSLLDGSNIKDEISLFNMGYFIGLGAEYSLGSSTALIVGLNYSNGFIDVTKSSSDKITLSGLSLKLGVLF